MSRGRKIGIVFSLVLSLFMVAGNLAYATESEPVEISASDEVDIRLGENQAIVTGYAGEVVSFDVDLYNAGTGDLTNVSIEPVAAVGSSDFPFDISEMRARLEVEGTLEGSRTQPDKGLRKKQVSLEYKVRSDVATGYMNVGFNVFYTYNGKNYVQKEEIFFKLVGAPTPVTPEAPASESAAATPAARPIPRVIVTGYETEPKEVKAGENFTLKLSVKNTSKTVKVSNLLFELTTPQVGGDNANTVSSIAFLPVSGSNSLYVEAIPSNGSTVLSIEMNAKSDLEQKPYVISLSMKYEDGEAKEYTSSADISIPVVQSARFSVSQPEVMPDALAVGEQGNVIFNIHNTGKRKLYNVRVVVEDETLEKVDAFVGNIEPGQTGNVDFMITGLAPTMGDGIVKGSIVYEDANGKEESKPFEMTVFVNEMPAMDDVPQEEETNTTTSSSKLPWIIGLVLVGIIVIVIVVVVIRKKVKAKKDENTGSN